MPIEAAEAEQRAVFVGLRIEGDLVFQGLDGSLDVTLALEGGGESGVGGETQVVFGVGPRQKGRVGSSGGVEVTKLERGIAHRKLGEGCRSGPLVLGGDRGERGAGCGGALCDVLVGRPRFIGGWCLGDGRFPELLGAGVRRAGCGVGTAFDGGPHSDAHPTEDDHGDDADDHSRVFMDPVHQFEAPCLELVLHRGRHGLGFRSLGGLCFFFDFGRSFNLRELFCFLVGLRLDLLGHGQGSLRTQRNQNETRFA